MLKGIDVSKWQGLMNWQKAKDAGVQFAIIRAGSIDNITGKCYEDTQFHNNVANLAPVDIPYALYWYFRPNHSAVKQAEYFLKLAGKADLGDLAVDLWCDIEVAGRADVVLSFLDLLDKSGKITGIYTNPNTILYLLIGDKSWMAIYDLWLADYTAPASVPKPWSEWLAWQYSSTGDGAKYGAASKGIDLNYAQDWMILPPVVSPDLEVRIKNLEDRVTALEQSHDDSNGKGA